MGVCNSTFAKVSDKLRGQNLKKTSFQGSEKDKNASRGPPDSAGVVPVMKPKVKKNVDRIELTEGVVQVSP